MLGPCSPETGDVRIRGMYPEWLRDGVLLIGTTCLLLAAGCSDFVGAECDSEGCDSASASTSEAGTTATVQTGTTANGTTGTTGNGTGPTDTGTTIDATASSTETTRGPGTETESNTETGPGTETGADTEPDADTGTIVPVCGDGVPEGDETCDDENTEETDGCLSTCVVPTSCAVILAEVPGATDGTYDIAPDGVLLTTACDMTTEGGGWTLVGKVNHADADGVGEPVGWFGTASNASNLAVPDLTLNGSPESHDAGRFSPIITEGTSVTRFELIEGGSVTESVEWLKVVGTTATFEAWFSHTDPDSSMVCTDVALTENCSSGSIQTQGDDVNNLTSLGGMRITHYLPAGDSFPIHIRQDNNTSSGSSGMISGTIGLAEWSQGYGGHNGNGLRIWLRE